jgi:hypothetical protein
MASTGIDETQNETFAPENVDAPVEKKEESRENIETIGVSAPRECAEEGDTNLVIVDSVIVDSTLEEDIVFDSDEGERSEEEQTEEKAEYNDDDYEEQYEPGQIVSAASLESGSDASSEIPPPPPPDQDSEYEEDIPSDEEGTRTDIIEQHEGDYSPPAESESESPPGSKLPPTTITTTTTEKDGPKYKTKVAARLAKALEDAEINDLHRSPELVPLTTSYQNLRKRLKYLIKSAEAYQKATRQVEQARSKLFQEFATLSRGTPLYDHVGKLLDADSLQSIEQMGNVSLATTSEGLELQAKSVTQVAEQLGAKSLASLQQLAAAHAKINSVEYQEHVLGYLSEWQQVVTSNVDKQLKAVKKLQQNRLHYEKKVESLRRKVNQLESKGKATPQAVVERLSRNEEKLKDAFENHEQWAGQLCVLLEQVTEHGWKDLYPLLKNTMKWEVNRLGRDNVTYGRLPETLDVMKISLHEHVQNA